jgi:hypothetical protein
VTGSKHQLDQKMKTKQPCDFDKPRQ